MGVKPWWLIFSRVLTKSLILTFTLGCLSLTSKEGTYWKCTWGKRMRMGLIESKETLVQNIKSRHSMFHLSRLPEIIFNNRARHKPGPTAAKLSELGPASAHYSLVQVRMYSLGEDFLLLLNIHRMVILGDMHKSNIPLLTLFISQKQLS